MLEIVRRHRCGSLLLTAQLIGVALLRHGSFTARKTLKMTEQRPTVRMKPLRARLALHLQGLQIVMKIVVGKVFARAVLIHGIIRPCELPVDMRRMRLLLNALLDRLPLRIADLRPSVVIGDPGRIVGIDHRNNARKGPNLYRHHAISFTWDSIKAISSADSPYFV